MVGVVRPVRNTRVSGMKIVVGELHPQPAGSAPAAVYQRVDRCEVGRHCETFRNTTI